MRKWIGLGAFLLAAAAGYASWPMVGLLQLGSALHSADADEALRRIDVVGVRRSILNQVLDEGTRNTDIDKKYGRIGRSVAVGFAVSALDRKLAQIMTPDALRTLVADGRIPASFIADLGDDAKASPGVRTLTFSGVPENPFRFIQRWRFSSPRQFNVVLGEAHQPENWTTFKLKRAGTIWRLSGIELPAAIIAKIKPAIEEKIARVRL